MDRNRIPGWANGLIDWLADSPMSVPGRIAARRFGRPAARGTTGTSEFEARDVRLLIAPVNYSGQGYVWARALEALDPGISARNMAVEVPGGFAFDADLEVPVGTYQNDADWQRRQFDAVAGASHVLIEAEEPPFGRMMGRSVARQADALLERGVDVAYLAHGTDARLPSRQRELNEWSYYHDESVYLPRAETVAARNIEFLRASGRRLFVSTPDLLLDLPEAVWCPVAVDPDRWSVPERARRAPGAPLRVVHAPSNPVLKGTPLIMPTLEKLIAEGVVEFEMLRGIPSAEMPERFARADVLLDQFRLGSYGVAACEAMAAGCVVVGQISDQVRAVVREADGAELPIVEANPGTLEETLRALAADDRFDELSERGVRFVRQVHSGDRAARILRDGWILPRTPDQA